MPAREKSGIDFPIRSPQPQPAQRVVYGGYQGKENPSERERILHLLDVYRSTDGFVAQYLPKWIEVSPSEAVKGGLRTVQAREAAHARLLKARLLELGGQAQAEVPAERREKEIPFFSSAERSDREKLQVLSNLFGNPAAFLKPVTDMVDQIEGDPQTRELLRTIADDEFESIKWIQAMYRTLSEQDARA